MILENILLGHKLEDSRHDWVINMISFDNCISPNVKTLFTKAYYKHKGFEGEIDLLQRFMGDTLLLFEVKSNHTKKNESKALYQLKKSRDFLFKFSDYEKIDCFYGFGLNKGYSWSYVLGR